jgi:hypothetical protein
MKLQITLHTDNQNIDTAHFISKMKELFKRYKISGVFEFFDEVHFVNGEWVCQYWAVYDGKRVFMTKERKIDFIKLAHTQVQRLEVIYNIFNLTLKQ